MSESFWLVGVVGFLMGFGIGRVCKRLRGKGFYDR